MTQAYVLFDRDGTLIKHVHYLVDPSKVELLANSAQGLELLRMGQCLDKSLRPCGDIKEINQRAVHAVGDDFLHRGRGGPYHMGPRTHRLDHRP